MRQVSNDNQSRPRHPGAMLERSHCTNWNESTGGNRVPSNRVRPSTRSGRKSYYRQYGEHGEDQCDPDRDECECHSNVFRIDPERSVELCEHQPAVAIQHCSDERSCPTDSFKCFLAEKAGMRRILSRRDMTYHPQECTTCSPRLVPISRLSALAAWIKRGSSEARAQHAQCSKYEVAIQRLRGSGRQQSQS